MAYPAASLRRSLITSYRPPLFSQQDCRAEQTGAEQQQAAGLWRSRWSRDRARSDLPEWTAVVAFNASENGLVQAYRSSSIGE